MESDKQQFLNQILLHHKCVPPCSEGVWCTSCMSRMMYADWLEENSREESDWARVEFIRLQIRGKDIPMRAQHKMRVYDRMYLQASNGVLKFEYEDYLRECVQDKGGDWSKVVHKYEPRVRVHTYTYEGHNTEWIKWDKKCEELVNSWGEVWTTIDKKFTDRDMSGYYDRRPNGLYISGVHPGELPRTLYGYPVDVEDTPVITWKYSRGFISHIELRTDDLLTYGEHLFKDSPIESVVLTDQRTPTMYHDMFRVVTDFHGVRGEGLRHEEALNNAIINWGRIEAGIIPPKSLPERVVY